MEAILQVAALAVTAALVALIVKRGSSEYGLLISVLACCILMRLCAGYLKPILTYLDELRQTADLNTAVTTPLLKAVAIGLITKISASICSDAKETALASFIELCGSILAIYVCLPLLETVLELMSKLLNGTF